MRRFWAHSLTALCLISLSASAFADSHGKFCHKRKTYRDKTTFIAAFDFADKAKSETYPALQADADEQGCNGQPVNENDTENHG